MYGVPVADAMRASMAPRPGRRARRAAAPPIEEPWRTLRDVYPVLRQRWSDLLANYGMPFSEYRVLERCARAPAMASEIALAVGLTPAGATDLIRRLERRHLVARVRHPDDRRAVLIRLTGAGKRRRREVRAGASALVRELNAAMTPAERRALAAGLAGLSRALRGEAGRRTREA
jgi:DNA-binding MarR family transcriptional regulator